MLAVDDVELDRRRRRQAALLAQSLQRLMRRRGGAFVCSPAGRSSVESALAANSSRSYNGAGQSMRGPLGGKTTRREASRRAPAWQRSTGKRYRSATVEGGLHVVARGLERQRGGTRSRQICLAGWPSRCWAAVSCCGAVPRRANTLARLFGQACATRPQVASAAFLWRRRLWPSRDAEAQRRGSSKLHKRPPTRNTAPRYWKVARRWAQACVDGSFMVAPLRGLRKSR